MRPISDQIEANIHEAISKKILPDETGEFILKHKMGDIVDAVIAVLPKSHVLQVKEFHEVFGHPINNKPHMYETQMLKRLGYIQEELKELEDAIKKGDVVELADVFVDLLYFINGGVVEAGMWQIINELFDEVHRSNMSKVCVTREDAQNTVKHWQDKGQGTCTIYPCSIGGFTVKRDSDGKTMKSISYSEADLKSIIDAARQ